MAVGVAHGGDFGAHVVTPLGLLIQGGPHWRKPNLSAVADSFHSTGRRPVFEVPFDRRLRPGGVIDLTRGISAPTRHTFLEIAAALGRH